MKRTHELEEVGATRTRNLEDSKIKLILAANAIIDLHRLRLEFDPHHGEQQTIQTYLETDSVRIPNDVPLLMSPNN
jgi:hypothetical protein